MAGEPLDTLPHVPAAIVFGFDEGMYSDYVKFSGGLPNVSRVNSKVYTIPADYLFWETYINSTLRYPSPSLFPVQDHQSKTCPRELLERRGFTLADFQLFPQNRSVRGELTMDLPIPLPKDFVIQNMLGAPPLHSPSAILSQSLPPPPMSMPALLYIAAPLTGNY